MPPPSDRNTKKSKALLHQTADVLPYLQLPGSADSADAKQFPIGDLIRRTDIAFKGALRLKLNAKERKTTFAQWAFLRILSNEDGLNQKVLAERVGVHSTTVVPALVILEREGYVRRTRSEVDKRHVTVTLTKEGRRITNAIVPMALEGNRKALQGISNEEAEKLMELLLKLIRNLES